MSVYKKAAKLIANSGLNIYGRNTFCCNVLKDLGCDTMHFNIIFRPENSIGAWYGDYTNKKNQLARSLALLFMHEISKDENK